MKHPERLVSASSSLIVDLLLCGSSRTSEPYSWLSSLLGDLKLEGTRISISFDVFCIRQHIYLIFEVRGCVSDVVLLLRVVLSCGEEERISFLLNISSYSFIHRMGDSESCT